jgi:hypothetical protein
VHATCWKLWLERNNRVFQNKSNSVMEGVESILWSVSEWASMRKEFNGLSVKDLYRSWSSFFKGGWRVKSRVAWMNPPVGVLKLNFDGSFVRSLRKGGIGGVIRDWNGKMVRSFYGPIDSSDANETELFALLIGCRELLQMADYGAILEGNSFSVIQWCFGNSSYPWNLADWVEELQDISRRVGATFNIFLGELMSWRIVLLVKEFLGLHCLLMFSFLFFFV